MTVGPEKETLLTRLLLLETCLFFAGMIFHFRAVSSISTGLLLITGLAAFKTKYFSSIFRSPAGPFLLSCILYFLYTGINLLLKDRSSVMQAQLEMKSALVLVPLAVSFTAHPGARSLKGLMKSYVLLLLAACLYCLLKAVMNWIHNGDESVFFYHALVRPLNQHAVFFSFLLFFSFLYIMEYGTGIDWLPRKQPDWILAAFFSLMLILLASKLILLCWLLTIFYYFLKGKTGRKKTGCLLATFVFLLLIALSKNPVSNRFREIIQTSRASLDREQFSEADYLNGLQFRYLQWKLVPKILTAEQSWPTGLGEEKGKSALQQQFIKLHLYQGQPGSADQGYLAYNTHNQFLQSLLTGGLVAMLLFGLICGSLLYLTARVKKPLVTIIVISLLLFSVTESCFETQYGLLFFTFLPLYAFILSSQLKTGAFPDNP